MSSITSDVSGIKNTFSSWDSCMSKAYCKWPVIVAIVIASLIVLSVVWCLARCLCCGAACCCSCLRCLDCFTPGRHGRSRESRHKDDYRPMPNNQGFQPMPSPMVYNQTPQFATFDSPSGKIHEDSLPAMPSWETAQSRRVEDDSVAQAHGDDVEMGRMRQPRTGGSGYNPVPSGPVSPLAPSPSPYGNRAQSTEYFGAAGAPPAAPNPYSSDLGAQRLGNPYPPPPARNQRYSSNFQTAPLSPAPTYNTHDPAYGNPAMAADRFGPNRPSPSPEYNRAYTHSPPQPDNFNRPYVPSVSTRYEPTEYNQSNYVSPTQQNAPQAFDCGNEIGHPSTNLSPTSQQRPPSLLQPGRKPVNGSFREI